MTEGEVLIKICGLRETAHVDAAIEAGADFLGIVFAESPRRVSLERARAIRTRVGPRVEVLDATASAFTQARRARWTAAPGGRLRRPAAG